MKEFVKKYNVEITCAVIAILATVAILLWVEWEGSRERYIKGDTCDIPILAYYCVEEDNPNAVSPEMFWYQMKALYDAHYQTVTFGDLINFVENDGRLREKAVVVTVTCSHEHVYSEVYPVLTEFGLKATVNITSDIDSGPGFLSNEQIKELKDSGVIDFQLDGQGLVSEEEPYTIELATLSHEKLDTALSKFEDVDCNAVALAVPSVNFTGITYDRFSDVGVKAFLSHRDGVSTIMRGDIESLRGLNRLLISEGVAPVQIITMCYTGEYK